MEKNKSSEVEAARRAGHRLRLRNRYLRAGLAGLEEYEMVELLLTYAIPRRDVKPYAKMLMERFGSLARLMDADPGELEEAAGLGEGSAVLISLIRALCTHYLEQKLRLAGPLHTPEDAVNFLRLKLGGGKRETLLVLLLDARHRLLCYEEYPGTIDRAMIFPRNVSELVLKRNAACVILAHNHPSGICDPSTEDIALTRRIKETLATIDVPLLDHIIVTPSDYLSLGQFLHWRK